MSDAQVSLDQTLKDKREEILRLAAKHGAKNVRVFGSVARGTAGPESGVDFLLDYSPDRTAWFPGGLIADLEELLGRKVHIVTESGLHQDIREKVLKAAVSL